MKNAVANKKGIEVETPSSHFPGILPKSYNTGAMEKYQSTSSVLTMSTMDLLLASECKPKPSRPSSQDEPGYSTSNALTRATPLPNSKIPRSPANRPQTQLAPELASGDISPQFKTSPSRYNISQHDPSAQSVPRSPWDGQSSRPSRLGPDSYGREIPLDALWTKIKRSVVSTEVLDQDGRRYEACVAPTCVPFMPPFPHTISNHVNVADPTLSPFLALSAAKRLKPMLSDPVPSATRELFARNSPGHRLGQNSHDGEMTILLLLKRTSTLPTLKPQENMAGHTQELA